MVETPRGILILFLSSAKNTFMLKSYAKSYLQFYDTQFIIPITYLRELETPKKRSQSPSLGLLPFKRTTQINRFNVLTDLTRLHDVQAVQRREKKKICLEDKNGMDYFWYAVSSSSLIDRGLIWRKY